MGSHIKGTNGKSQGVVPFLKVANDTAVAVNQGGKRKGAMCAYLETWHLDIEDFLDLRKNTGEERRRTHDMNTANWIPDLFMKRVAEEGQWTLFSPCEVPDLHDLYGKEFETAYVAYEEKADRGEIKNFRRIQAVDLWRKMLGMLFETGHPWMTFKDPCNIRSPQQHTGVVHSSNLCTEITLNTSDTEIAVCNLGSVNLAPSTSMKTASTWRSSSDDQYRDAHARQRHRLQLLQRAAGAHLEPAPSPGRARHHGFPGRALPPAHPLQLGRSDRVRRRVDGSGQLLRDPGLDPAGRGTRHLLQLPRFAVEPGHSADRLGRAKLREARGDYLQQDDSARMNWDSLRQRVMSVGMRNSNTMAIAPTATISNICGVSQSIEPIYQNLFVKSNLSGEFTVVNPYLVDDLKAEGLWDDVMVNDLKYYDGSVQHIDRVPDELKAIYATAFEIDSRWLVEAASRRQKWIDQGQSLNLYMAEPSGKKLDNLYKLAWVRGLKTTYYLRSLGATAVENPQPALPNRSR